MYLECGHYYCKECFNGYYSCLIKEAKLYWIKCPYKDCKVKVKDETVKELFKEDSQTLEKFKKFKLNMEVAQSRNKKFCPQPNCEAVCQGKTTAPKTQCHSCKNFFCFNCQTGWHEGKTCKQHNHDVYGEWAAKIGAHKCPKCGSGVERSEGCPHMHCTLCNYRWCWVCGHNLNNEVHQAFEKFFCSFLQDPPQGKGACKFYVFICVVFLLLPLIILAGVTGVVTYGCFYLSNTAF